MQGQSKMREISMPDEDSPAQDGFEVAETPPANVSTVFLQLT